MSRGGRGRGGGRGGRPALPWEDVDEPDARPSDLFPPYVVTTPRQLTPAESASVQHFLLLRRQMHSSPLYTSRRTSLIDPAAPRKTYGRDQMNALYDVKSRASLDPFTAVPTYSQRFTRTDRALPDWAARPVCREMYPAELVDTVDGEPQGAQGAQGARRKRRKLELSRVEALPNPEEAFGMAREQGAGGNILDRLDAIKDDEEEVDDAEEEEDAGGDEEDEVYDDEDAGDYDAENYFDNGDDGGDDYGDEDGEGTY